MTTKQIKMWLIALGFAIVAGKLIWTTYSEMSVERCQTAGGTWSVETKACEPAATPQPLP